jgi:Xaa-Pro aminopeptidase
VGQAFQPADPLSSGSSRPEGRLAGSEFPERRRAVAAGLTERKLDAFLVAFSPNLRYLTGFTGSNGNLLVTRGESILFTDPRYTIQAQSENGDCRIAIAKGRLVAGVAAAIAKLGLKRIGYEPARMTCDLYESLKSSLPMRASLHPVAGWIEELRMVKSPAEIERIRRSVQTNSQAFDLAVARLRPGVKERDFAAELEYRMRRLGAEKPAFETIVAGGVRSALPHAQPTAAPLHAGDLVMVDMGAFVQGYASDMTRMLFLGQPDAKVKRTYKAVLEAQLAAIDAVRAGVMAARVDRAARATLKGRGLDRAFIHATGHGLGLEIHEPPRIGNREKTRLRAGMTITIEPGVYLEGWGGIRIEDTVLVTGNGCEILTTTSKELAILTSAAYERIV